MLEEKKYSMVNILVSLILVFAEIIGGMLLRSYSLICVGYYSLCNLLLHYLTHISSNIRGRRVDMRLPFGVGRLEFAVSALIGAAFMVIGMYVFEKSFYLNYMPVNPKIFVLIVLVALFKYSNLTYAYNVAKKSRSQMMMVVAQNHYKDLIFTVVPFIMALFSLYDPNVDIVGCLIISFFIFIKGIKIVRYNFMMEHGQNDNSTVVNNKIKNIVDNYKDINIIDISLVNVKNYYMAIIDIEVDSELSLFEVLRIERKIMRKVSKERMHVRELDFIEYERQ